MAKVLIIGAGASHGHGVASADRPPLAPQFFSHPLSRSLKAKYITLGAYLRKHVGFDADANARADIERVFPRVEAAWRLGHYDWKEIVRRYGPRFVSASPIDMLRSYVTDLVRESTGWAWDQHCPFHEFLVSSWLRSGDKVISFNYDLLMDCALKRSRMWNEVTGYGFRDEELLRVTRDAKKSAIVLLKPHGSLNWFRSSRLQQRLHTSRDKEDSGFDSTPAIRILSLDDARLGKTPHVAEDGAVVGVALRVMNLFEAVMPADYLEEQQFDFNVELLGRSLVDEDLYIKGYLPLMIMPTPNKPFQEMAFAELSDVWKQTRSAVETAEEVLAIGFSFRDDHFNQMMFEAGSLRTDAVKLTVVTKKAAEVRAVRKRFTGTKIVVEHFNGWFCDYVGSHRAEKGS